MQRSSKARAQVDAHDPMHNMLLAPLLRQTAGLHLVRIPTFFLSCPQSSCDPARFQRKPHNSSSSPIDLPANSRPICEQLLPLHLEIGSMTFHRSSCFSETLPKIDHLHKCRDANLFFWLLS